MSTPALPATLALILFVAVGGPVAAAAATANPPLMLTKAKPKGDAPNGTSWGPVISPSGRFVAFGSTCSNIVATDFDVQADVFVRDLKSGKLQEVNMGSGGWPVAEACYLLAMSDDGRRIAFLSNSSSLGFGDDSAGELMIHDRKTGLNEIASVNDQGVPGNKSVSYGSMSGNGRYCVFATDASNLAAGANGAKTQIFLRDRKKGTTELISVGIGGLASNGYCSSPTVSNDGRFVCFSSEGNNLVPGDVQGQSDVFLRDRTTGITIRVDADNFGTPSPQGAFDGKVSANGRKVVFSTASSLVPSDDGGLYDAYVYDVKGGFVTLASIDSYGGANGDVDSASISANGRFVTYATRTSPVDGHGMGGKYQAVIRDLKKSKDRVLSVAKDGSYGTGDCRDAHASRNGKTVVFGSEADNLDDAPCGSGENVFVAR